MIVIFNTNGSIYDAEMADYVQQGSNGANRLQVAYVDSARSGLSAYLIAERPNGTTITLPAHKTSFDCNGERYQGWEVTITGSFTLYAGVVHCTLNIVDEDDQIQANYPFDVTVNATGNPIDANWDEQINVAQYNAFMAMLSGKATINRVESKDELPVPGQRSVLWLVGTDKYDAYAWDPESEEYRTILNGIYVVGNIVTADISGLPNGYIIYSSDTASIYRKDTSVQAGYAKLYDIASKSWVGDNFIPYVGATKDADLGGFFIRNAKTENEYLNHKEDEDNISSVKFVLGNALSLDEANWIGEGEYPYLLKPNSTILFGGDIYKHITDTQTDLVYACFNGSVTTQTDGTSLHLGAILKISKTEVGGVHQYDRASIDIGLYSKDQAKTKFATDFTWEIDNTTYVMTFKLKNANGGDLRVRTLDLPLESIVSGATYYDTYTYDGTTYTKVIVITLSTTSVPTIVPVGDLISGLEKEACVELSSTSGTLTSTQKQLLALDNASIKHNGNYLHKLNQTTFLYVGAIADNSTYKTLTEIKAVVNFSSGAYAITTTTAEMPKPPADDGYYGCQVDSGTPSYKKFDYDFDDESENALQNKVITSNLSEKLLDDVMVVSDTISVLSGYYVSKTTGQLHSDANSYYSDFISTSGIKELYVSSKSNYDTCIIASYDENQNFIRSYGDTTTWDAHKFIPQDDEKYIRVCGYTRPFVIFNKSYASKLSDTDNKVDKIMEGYFHNDTRQPQEIVVYTGKCLIASTGQLSEIANSFYTDYIRTDIAKKFYVTAFSRWSTCIMATYDKDHRLIRIYGAGTDNGVYYDKEEYVPQTDEYYVVFSSLYTPLVVAVDYYSPYVANDVDTRKSGYVDITENLELRDGYYNRASGEFASLSGAKATQILPVSQGELYKISGDAQFSTSLIVTFDRNMSFKRAYGIDGGNHVISEDFEFTPQTDEYYVAFGTYREDTYPLTIKKYKKISMYEWVASIQKDLDNTSDVLKGKKYVACGDSFTSDNGNSAFKGKTYPDLIAKRNGMKLLNMAKSGTYAHNGQDGFTNPSNGFYYQNIPQDADYITIAYGLNETGATIGDSSSSDNTTIWGAYNEILAWLIENRPNAKIGIISNDAWQTAEMRNALKEISAFWGVSFLDLKEYGKPLMIGGKFASDGSVSSSAVNLRNAQYQVSELDSHPNTTAHAARSTIIEEWLRGM